MRTKQNAHVDVLSLRRNPGTSPSALSGCLMIRHHQRSLCGTFIRKLHDVIIRGAGFFLTENRMPRPDRCEPLFDFRLVQDVRLLIMSKAVAFVGHRLNLIAFFLQFAHCLPHRCAGDSKKVAQLLPGKKSFCLRQSPEHLFLCILLHA